MRETQMVPSWRAGQVPVELEDGATVIVGGTVFVMEDGVLVPTLGSGAPGPVGPEGPMGPQGPRGLTGLKGDPGPVGPAGEEGPPGVQGEQGPVGPTGVPGADGTSFELQGSVASSGDLPAEAPTGHAYFVGANLWVRSSSGWVDAGTVAQGPAGPQGDPGPQGVPGERGATGPAGPQGIQGPAGSGTGAGLRQRGSWTPRASYSPGDVVRHEGATYVVTREVAGSAALAPNQLSPGAGSAAEAVYRYVAPRLVSADTRITLPSRAGWDGGERAVVRSVFADRTAYLNSSDRDAVVLNPAVATLRARRDSAGAVDTFDGLVMEFTIPTIAGWRPVGVHMGAVSAMHDPSSVVHTFQLDGVGASPSYNSVGMPDRAVPGGFGDTSKPRASRPAIGRYVGTHHTAYENDFWSQGAQGTDIQDLRLGEGQGYPDVEPLDLGWSKLTLLLVRGGTDLFAGQVKSSQVHGAGLRAPSVTVEYAPVWEPLERPRRRRAAGTFSVVEVAVLSRTEPGVVQAPRADGTLLLPPGGILVMRLATPVQVDPESRVSVSTPWGAGAHSGLRGRVVLDALPGLSAASWSNAPEVTRETLPSPRPFWPEVSTPEVAALAGGVAFHNESGADRVIPATRHQGVSVVVA